MNKCFLLRARHGIKHSSSNDCLIYPWLRAIVGRNSIRSQQPKTSASKIAVMRL
jgi:hypothetical protein